MNYFAHARHCLADPYQVAGVAVPDWLCLTQPRLRCRSRHARPWIEAEDPAVAAVARGVVQHHADDDWFHQTPAFGDLSLELARRIRRVTADTDGMRPGFLGHILLELLLDAALDAQRPDLLHGYYNALACVDAGEVARIVSTMTGGDAAQLAPIIERFVELRFLHDYADDERLLFRLNQVMHRVRLPQLPERFTTLLPGARELVASHVDELLTPASVAGARA